jgi:hypothetical protein
MIIVYTSVGHQKRTLPSQLEIMYAVDMFSHSEKVQDEFTPRKYLEFPLTK